jgi:hypothetical protein
LNSKAIRPLSVKDLPPSGLSLKSHYETFPNTSGVRGMQAMQPGVKKTLYVSSNFKVSVFGHSWANKVGRLSNSSMTLIKLCSKLAVLTKNYRSTLKVGRRKFFVNYDVSLPRSSLKKLRTLNDHDWSHLEGIWTSFGSLILGNPSLNLKLSANLLDSVLKFKVNLISYVMKNTERKLIVTRTTKVLKRLSPDLSQNLLDNPVEIAYEQRSVTTNILPGILRNIEDYIKSISILLQWKLFNNSYRNEMPYDIVPRIFSWNNKLGYPILKIFGGHLVRYRHILSPLFKCTKHDLIVISTMRSVGRSLPPSSEDRVLSDVEDSIRAWKTPIGLDQKAQSMFKKNLDIVLHEIKVGLLPTRSHVSLTSSALYETPRSMGGQVDEIRRKLKVFEDDQFTVGYMPNVEQTSILVDAFYNKATTFSSLMSTNCSLRSHVYRDLRQEHLFAIKADRLGLPVDNNFLNCGHCLMWLSTGEALLYGSYDPPPDVLVMVGEFQLPLWIIGRVIYYKPRVIDVRLAASATAGCKTRVITVNRLYTSLIGTYMHHMFEEVLVRSPIYKMGQSLLWYAVELFDKDHKAYYYSQDLKSSTDFIPHQLMSLMWNTVCRAIRSKNEFHPFLVFHRLITFPRNVFRPLKLGGPEYFLTHRGSLMGDPMSFMTLSLLCLVIDRCIKNMSGRYVHSPSLVLGDDYVTKLRNEDECKAASKITESFGVVLSRKHGYSKRALIFAESVGIHSSGLHFVDSLKLRLLTMTPSTRMGDQSVSFLGKARELKKFIEYTGSDSIKKIVDYLFWENIRVFYGEDIVKTNLPLWLPTELGGLDFPMKSYSDPKWINKYIHYFNHFSSLSDEEQLVESLQIQNIYHNNRKAIWDDIDSAIEVFLKYFKGYSHGTSYDGIDRKTFYNRVDLKAHYLHIIEKVDFPSLSGVTEYELALRQTHIYSVRYVLDQINRYISFSKILKEPKRVKPVSLYKWLTRARRFWWPRISNRPSDEDTLFIPLKSIVKHFNELLDVFVYIPEGSILGSDSFSLNLRQFDPITNKLYATTPDYIGVQGSDIYCYHLYSNESDDVTTMNCGPYESIQSAFSEAFWMDDD